MKAELEVRYARQWMALRLGLLALALVGGYLACDALGGLWGRLRGSLPEGWNASPHIVIELPPGVEARPGTPLVRIEPRLQLLGEIEREARFGDLDRPYRGAGRLWYASVRPEAFAALREDARLFYSGQALEVMEIFAAFLSEDRLAGIAAELGAWGRAHRADLELLRDELWKRLRARFGEEEAGELLADPEIRAALLLVLRRQVVEEIDWPQVIEELSQGEAMEGIGRWLASSLQAGPLLERASDAFLGQIFADLWRPLQRLFEDPVLFAGDVVREVVIFSLRWAVGRDSLGLTLERGRDLVGSLRASFARAGSRAGEAAKRDALEQLQRAWRDDPAKVAGLVGTLAADLGETLDLEARLLAMLRELSAQPALRRALERHGEEAREKLAAVLAELWRSESVRAVAGRLARDLGRIGARIVRSAMLNRSGDGWNPMVLALLREKMLGRSTPMIIVQHGGSGASVASGTLFEVHAEPGTDPNSP